MHVCIWFCVHSTDLADATKKKKKKESPLVLYLSGPSGTASWWQMDWLYASAASRLGALYSSLLGKTEPFFFQWIPVCWSDEGKHLWHARGREESSRRKGIKKKKKAKRLANTINPKCSISSPVVRIVYRVNTSMHHVMWVVVGFFGERWGPTVSAVTVRDRNSLRETHVRHLRRHIFPLVKW